MPKGACHKALYKGRRKYHSLTLSLSKGQGNTRYRPQNFTFPYFQLLYSPFENIMEATVYILECADGSYYTGLTKQDVEARVWEHNEGIYKGYTSKRLPVKLVFMEIYERLTDAINREQQIKGWNRKKKQALIALNYEALPDLSKNRQKK